MRICVFFLIERDFELLFLYVVNDVDFRRLYFSKMLDYVFYVLMCSGEDAKAVLSIMG